MRKKFQPILVFQAAYSSAKQEPTPWGLLLFLGLGFVLYLLLCLLDVWPLKKTPHIEDDAGNKILSAVYFFAFFIIIVSIRAIFESLWGDKIANGVGIVAELISIAIFLLLSLRRT
jgi:hypothetical protein